MPRWLEDLDISEISLVDKAANKKKRFHVIKEKKKMNFIEVIQKFFEEKAGSNKVDLKKFMEDEEIKEALEEDEEILAMLEKAEKLPEKAMTALKGAYKILSKYKDDFTAELKGALKTISKYVSYGYPEKSDTEKVAKFDVGNLTEEAIEKAGRAFSKATVAELEKVRDLIIKLIGEKKKMEKADGRDKLPEDIKKKLDEYERLKKEKEEEEKKRVEKLEEENAQLKKKLAKKKSIDDQDDDDDVKKNEEDKWPSLG